MSKEQYIREYERIVNDLMDQGMSEKQAENIAAEKAYPAMVDRIAAQADYLRMLKKEGGLK